MASRIVTEAFNSISDLKLWYSIRSGDTYKLSHITEIIPLRWEYFKENWDFIKSGVESKIDQYVFPDKLREQIIDLTGFIEKQRNNQNKNVNPFSSSKIVTRFYAVWDNIEITSIALTRTEQNIVDKKINRISNFIRTDFENIRDNLTAARDETADVIGLTDEDYNNTIGRSSAAALKTANISGITETQTYQSAIKSVNLILANSNSLSTVAIDPFALARQNASNPEIQIATGQSSNLVRMKYGDSLQTLAHRYLGNSDRWVEIAIANGLSAPYVDEIGEGLSLLSNGKDSRLSFSATTNGTNTVNKLYIGQPIFLSSDTIKFPEQRTILNITEVPISGELVVEVNGEADLDKFKISENTVVRVYKQNTVNSQFFVAIPSSVPLDDTQIGETPFFLQASSEDEKRAGIDLLLGDDGDLVFGSTGDLSLSYGLENALQSMKLKILSERGQSKRHPDYGLPSVMGQKERDPNIVKEMLVNGINEMVTADPRFDRIEQIEVRRGEKTDVSIALTVRMAGTGTLVPLSFKLSV